MTEPCAVAYHAVARSDIGLMATQRLRLRGCSLVIVSEIDPKKRAIAGETGLTAIDAAFDPVAAIKEATGGGADVVHAACRLPFGRRSSRSGSLDMWSFLAISTEPSRSKNPRPPLSSVGN